MRNGKILTLIFSLLFAFQAQGWESNIAYYEDGQGGSSDGRLTYVSDTESNRVPDFSQAGYRGGGVAIPNIPTVTTIAPIAGDNRQHIQDALDNAPTPGAVLLQPGDYYDVSGPIYLNRDGLVLRGVLDSNNPDDPLLTTIIRGTETDPALPDHKRTVLVVGGGSTPGAWRQNSDTVAYPVSNITTPFVPLGSRCFEVADASGFAIGDNIIVIHPSTQEWIDAVDGGGVIDDPPWTPTGPDGKPVGEQFFFNRFITNISGNAITVDAPIYNSLDLSLSQSYIYKYDRANIKTEIGVEDLKVTTAAISDLDHAWNTISFYQIEDGWAKNVRSEQFIQAAFIIRNGTRLTFENCFGKTTLSDGVAGSTRYAYNCYRASNNILFKGCTSEDARHAFISNGTSAVAGVVVLDSFTTGDYLESGGHRRWTMGLLYDNLSMTSPNSGNGAVVLGLFNRGDAGSSHGWASVNSVAWATNGPMSHQQVIQKPPTAQNFAIGCVGDVTGSGYIEAQVGQIHPRSLYEAQLAERQTYGAAPSAPVITAGTKIMGDVLLTWLPTLDVPQADLLYLIERSDDGGASFNEIAMLSGLFTTFTDTTAVGSVIYRIRAKNTANNNRSAYSNPYAATAPGNGYSHIRFYAPGGQSYSRIDLKEFRVFEPGSSTNIALNKPATASGYRSNRYDPSKAVDGRSNTKWSVDNNGGEQWLAIDLEGEFEIGSVDLIKSNRTFPSIYEIQVSYDGVNWATFEQASAKKKATPKKGRRR